MTSWVVADAGSLVATAFKETHSEVAAELWKYWDTQRIAVTAPTLFHYEVVAVVRKNVYKGIITPEEGIRVRDRLLARRVTLMIDQHLLRRAYEIATQFNQPTAYDSQYLAVAERLGCEFWTLDEKLFNIVSHTLPWVKWVGNFTP